AVTRPRMVVPRRVGSTMMRRQARASTRVMGCGNRMIPETVPASSLTTSTDHHATSAERCPEIRGARLRAGLAVGDPTGEVAAAWQGKELLRAVYAASELGHARAALERVYRWSD